MYPRSDCSFSRHISQIDLKKYSADKLNSSQFQKWFIGLNSKKLAQDQAGYY